MITIRPMLATDIPGLAADARQADIEEMRDGAGVTIEQALQFGLKVSTKAWVIEADGLAIAAVGDAPHDVATGVPWMVTTVHVEAHSRGFLRATKSILLEMRQRYGCLLNLVDARNVVAIRWLEWLGFTVGPAVPAGVRGLPFHQFKLDRSNRPCVSQH